MHNETAGATQDQMHPTEIFLSLVGSAIMTTILCQFALPLSKALHLIDKPDVRKLHPTPTPLIGGLALLLVGVPGLFMFLLTGSSPQTSQHLLVLVMAMSAMVMVGLADDKHDLTARDRLLISFLVFVSVGIFDKLFAVHGLTFRFAAESLPLPGSILSVAFSTLCCVGLINAINMADGKNGLVTGLGLGWLTFLGFHAPSELVPAIAILVGVMVVLFAFNLRGLLFLGDGGAYGLATALALIAIAIYNWTGPEGQRYLFAEDIALLFSIPVLDAIRLAITRTLSGQSPLAADRNHLHHHLQARFGWPGGLVAYHILALGLPVVLILAIRR